MWQIEFSVTAVEKSLDEQNTEKWAIVNLLKYAARAQWAGRSGRVWLLLSCTAREQWAFRPAGRWLLLQCGLLSGKYICESGCCALGSLLSAVTFLWLGSFIRGFLIYFCLSNKSFNKKRHYSVTASRHWSNLKSWNHSDGDIFCENYFVIFSPFGSLGDLILFPSFWTLTKMNFTCLYLYINEY